MTSKRQNEPKQRTQKGQEIPVPKRGEFLKNLKKVAKPSPTSRPKK